MFHGSKFFFSFFLSFISDVFVCYLWELIKFIYFSCSMFMSSCKRLRIMKASEARGLGCGVWEIHYSFAKPQEQEKIEDVFYMKRTSSCLCCPSRISNLKLGLSFWQTSLQLDMELGRKVQKKYPSEWSCSFFPRVWHVHMARHLVVCASVMSFAVPIILIKPWFAYRNILLHQQFV